MLADELQVGDIVSIDRAAWLVLVADPVARAHPVEGELMHITVHRCGLDFDAAHFGFTVGWDSEGLWAGQFGEATAPYARSRLVVLSRFSEAQG